MNTDLPITWESLIGTWQAESVPEGDSTDVRVLQFCEDHTYVLEMDLADYGLNRSWFYYDVRDSDTLLMMPMGKYRLAKDGKPWSQAVKMEGGKLYLGGAALKRLEDREVPEKMDLMTMIRKVEGVIVDRKVRRIPLLPLEQVQQEVDASVCRDQGMAGGRAGVESGK